MSAHFAKLQTFYGRKPGLPATTAFGLLANLYPYSPNPKKSGQEKTIQTRNFQETASPHLKASENHAINRAEDSVIPLQYPTNPKRETLGGVNASFAAKKIKFPSLNGLQNVNSSDKKNKNKLDAVFSLSNPNPTIASIAE